MVVESRLNQQQTSFLIKTAVFSRPRNVKLRHLFISFTSILSNCLNFRFVGETILLNKESFARINLICCFHSVILDTRIDIDN